MKKICIMVMLLLILCTTCIASQSPSKMKIGDTDGQWTYIGIYKSPEIKSPTIKDFILYAQPRADTDKPKDYNYDVYFHHVHNKEYYNQKDGVGCGWYKNEQTGEMLQKAYNCVIKLIPLDKTGKPILVSGPDGETIILSITGYPRGPQQIFALNLTSCRTYDAISHQLITDLKEGLNNVSRISGNEHNILNKFGDKSFGDNVYRRAARMSNCPH